MKHYAVTHVTKHATGNSTNIIYIGDLLIMARIQAKAFKSPGYGVLQIQVWENGSLSGFVPVNDPNEETE